MTKAKATPKSSSKKTTKEVSTPKTLATKAAAPKEVPTSKEAPKAAPAPQAVAPKEVAPKQAAPAQAQAAPKETPKRVAPKKEPRVAQAPISHGVGRRKSSVARAWLYRGTGAFLVNKAEFSKYFDTTEARLEASRPLQVLQAKAPYTIQVNVVGGGRRGQAGAVRLAVARALVAADDSLKSVMRNNGLLTVDSRLKERKKYGQKSARRKFQFVKR